MFSPFPEYIGVVHLAKLHFPAVIFVRQVWDIQFFTQYLHWIGHGIGDNVRKAADLILGTARKIQKNYIGIGETEIRRMSWNDISLDGSKAILVRTNRMAYQLSTTQGAAIFFIKL